ncbi:5-bromo-4-chloroindolyl phosphate hydrolysis family protein [Clostridium bornimense]|mgnify:FL=1|uniref:5-bromo-4-chloroindolyl phosphate hydrolysis family protein n=1 Tax=Clostridium bornimense TaxID=1216932 RepID=UPI001C0FC904|nr:5-bromo-4-chloroindolyl phosphate hydrolysis family protein [Clostridium bornimense]MBU5317211.1 5-bromo-4-chloroindolyl phosphate hydrolysis family protein [Clostridium bornimense]
MDRNDFSHLEDQIRSTVENATRYVEFAKSKVNNTMEDTLNEVISKVNNTSSYIERKVQENLSQNNYKRNNSIRVKKNISNMYIANKPVGGGLGIFLNVIGTIGTIGFAIPLAICSIVMLSKANSGSNIIIAVYILALFFIGSVFITYKGASLRNRGKRFKKYVRCILGRNYCRIDELASSVDKSNNYVIKDLRRMIRLDMFREGHIDDEKTYFMLSNKVYEEYLQSKESYNRRKNEESKKSNASKEENEKKSDVESITELREKYIAEIRNSNNAIVEKDISMKLDRLEKIVEEIFKQVEKNPEKLSEVRKFTNHYLPMTLKLVNSYKELSNQYIEGDNIKKAKSEIEKSMDLINGAFANLLDDLFEDVVLDISSDIEVLKTLFTQEGLTENDFKKDDNGGV